MNPDLPKVYAVVGSGYMGGGIAQALALAGAHVNISDVDLETADQNRARLIAEARKFVADGLFEESAPEHLEARLSAMTLEEAVASASFVVEAVPERVAVKHETLRRISAAAPADAIIGTNTSTILIRTLAEAVTQPARFLGVHFANPSPFVPGVEIIPHAGTDASVVERAREIISSIGKKSSVVGDATGFVMNRLQYALFHEATQLVEEGVAEPEEIDTIVRTTFGFRLPFFGPFAVADMAGLDVYNFCYESLQTEFPERFQTPKLLTDLLAAGRLGVKSGGGFLPIAEEQSAALIAYRNRAYVGLMQLIEELGPSPLDDM